LQDATTEANLNEMDKVEAINLLRGVIERVTRRDLPQARPTYKPELHRPPKRRATSPLEEGEIDEEEKAEDPPADDITNQVEDGGSNSSDQKEQPEGTLPTGPRTPSPQLQPIGTPTPSSINTDEGGGGGPGSTNYPESSSISIISGGGALSSPASPEHINMGNDGPSDDYVLDYYDGGENGAAPAPGTVAEGEQGKNGAEAEPMEE